LENGAAIVAATGRIDQCGVHLPALANEAAILHVTTDVGPVFARTPLIGNLRPAGNYREGCLHIGGTAVSSRADRKRSIDGSCRRLRQDDCRRIRRARRPTAEIITSAGAAISPDGGSRF